MHGFASSRPSETLHPSPHLMKPIQSPERACRHGFEVPVLFQMCKAEPSWTSAERAALSLDRLAQRFMHSREKDWSDFLKHVELEQFDCLCVLAQRRDQLHSGRIRTDEPSHQQPRAPRRRR